METDIFNQQRIIQIELFQYEQLATNKLIRIIEIGLFLLLLIGMIIYYFNIDFTIILLGLSLLVIAFSFLFLSLINYFTTDNTTLIIAFGELQLMKNKKIIWQENIDYLDFKYKPSSSQIPIIIIKGTSFSKISFGYGRPKVASSNQKIDYLIFSKLDWRILKKYAQEQPFSNEQAIKIDDKSEFFKH